MRKCGLFAVVSLLVTGLSLIAAEPRQELAFPDIEGYRTLKCDLHMHTVFSDGRVWPTVRVDEAWREGLDAIAITDHIEYKPHKADVTPSTTRPYDIAAPAAAEQNILLVHGAEITRDTPPGHFNALFVKNADKFEVKDFDEQFTRVQEQNGYVFWNHPGWQGRERGQWGPEQDRLLERRILSGIEICNGDEFYPEAFAWAIEKNLSLFGNSDIHAPSNESQRTAESHRTLTLVFAKKKSLESLEEAVRAGRTVVWWKNHLYGREPYLSPLFDACVTVKPYRQSGNTTWVEIHNGCETDINLRKGSTGSPAKLSLPAKSTIRTKFESPATQPTQEWSYEVANWLTAPDRPLRVKLVITTKD